jgi:hypothetical protein
MRTGAPAKLAPLLTKTMADATIRPPRYRFFLLLVALQAAKIPRLSRRSKKISVPEIFSLELATSTL